PIPLDLQEMGLDENLLAKIQAIEQCPEIRAGPGRVVLTTVNHLSRGICKLTYTTQDGKNETIRPTITHRFYSLDRKEWIHIGDARFGEKLQGLGNNVITVISCQPLGTTERVYNMTVEEDHVYYVGKLNLLAHNTRCSPTLPSSSPIPFRRANRIFHLEQGNARTGWTHIYNRHIDSSQELDATKFPDNWSEGDIFLMLDKTIRHGQPGSYYDKPTFTYHGNYKGSGYRDFRVTINPDGTIQTFHMMER
ncbi:MAG: HINT domain-containing protein, partial [Planctomycetaceae bacterium]|nr:HINT domain-containing protein [Planctomycetaceae bacterium]